MRKAMSWAAMLILRWVTLAVLILVGALILLVMVPLTAAEAAATLFRRRRPRLDPIPGDPQRNGAD